MGPATYQLHQGTDGRVRIKNDLGLYFLSAWDMADYILEGHALSELFSPLWPKRST